MTREIDLSICLVNWNTKNLLFQCIHSILENKDALNIEIFVVDNASQDGSAEMVLKEFPEVHLIANKENVGFARANNQGINLSRGRNILLLNPDTIVLPGALTRLVNFLDSNRDAGAVAAKLYNHDRTLQLSVRRFPTLLTPFTENSLLCHVPFMQKFTEHSRMMDWDHDTLRVVEQPAGAAFMVKRAVFETLGKLDGRYHMFFEDVDLCYRIKMNGWKIYYHPDAEIIHYGGSSVMQRKDIGEEFYRSLLTFFKKNYGRFSEIQVRSIMLLGGLFYMGYSLFNIIRNPGYAMKIAKTSFNVMRYGIRSLDSAGI